MSSSNCCFLTCIQISQEGGQVVWYSHLLKNFPQFIVIHTVKGFGIENKAEIDVCLQFSCFFDDPADIGNLISGSPAFLKPTLFIWKFLVHILLMPSLKDFEPNLASMWNEHNCISFAKYPCFLYAPSNINNWSLVPLPFLNPDYTFGSSQFTYHWSLAGRILSLT